MHTCNAHSYSHTHKCARSRRYCIHIALFKPWPTATQCGPVCVFLQWIFEHFSLEICIKWKFLDNILQQFYLIRMDEVGNGLAWIKYSLLIRKRISGKKMYIHIGNWNWAPLFCCNWQLNALSTLKPFTSSFQWFEPIPLLFPSLHLRLVCVRVWNKHKLWPLNLNDKIMTFHFLCVMFECTKSF